MVSRFLGETSATHLRSTRTFHGPSPSLLPADACVSPKIDLLLFPPCPSPPSRFSIEDSSAFALCTTVGTELILCTVPPTCAGVHGAVSVGGGTGGANVDEPLPLVVLLRIPAIGVYISRRDKLSSGTRLEIQEDRVAERISLKVQVPE